MLRARRRMLANFHRLRVKWNHRRFGGFGPMYCVRPPYQVKKKCPQVKSLGRGHAKWPVPLPPFCRRFGSKVEQKQPKTSRFGGDDPISGQFVKKLSLAFYLSPQKGVRPG